MATLLLPLDDRPCNLLFPSLLSRIAGVKLLLPPVELLGHFTAPGDVARLSAWLEQRWPKANCSIISADMLVYGGLMASRDAPAGTDEVRQRLAVLQRMKSVRPRAPIWVFSALRRLGISVDSEEKLQLHSRLVLYSKLAGRAERMCGGACVPELAEVFSQLKPDQIESYLAARRRKLEMNLELVNLLERGVIDLLFLTQEDAAEAGLHVEERQRLHQAIAEKGLQGRALIYPGADEAACVILARWALRRAKWSPRIRPWYSTPQGGSIVALYEDRPLADTVRGQVEAAGAQLADWGDPEAAQTDSLRYSTRGKTTADMFLLLHTPVERQTEAAAGVGEEQAGTESLADMAASNIRKGSPVAVADVRFCNGADPQLARELMGRGLFPKLSAYGGWNTAANTIGGALAQMIVAELCDCERRQAVSRRRGEALLRPGESVGRHVAQPPSAVAARTLNQRFLFERLVDDLAYQSCIRQEAAKFVRQHLGVSPLNLKSKWRVAERFVRERLSEKATELFHEAFSKARPRPRLRGLDIRLPWPRLFEVSVEADLTL